MEAIEYGIAYFLIALLISWVWSDMERQIKDEIEKELLDKLKQKRVENE